MLFAKIKWNVSAELAMPIPELTREEAEAALNAPGAKEEIEREIFDRWTKGLAADGGVLTEKRISIEVVER